ncbi:MAG: hypothetical protein LAT53_07720 [Idiomarina sp.]|nr:hypothetical protein [Idiomarina sp.]
MKKILHIAYLVIISVLLILLWQEQSTLEPSISATPYQSSVAEQRDAAERGTSRDYAIDIDEANLEAMIAELQAENHALRMQLEEREGELAELRAEEDEASVEVASIENNGQSSGSAALQRAMQSAIDGHLSGDEMNVRREEEPVDPDWAYPVEQGLQDFFISQEEFRDFTLASVECRTSYCELKVTSDQAGKRFDSSALHRYMREQEWYENGMMMAFENPETGETTVILEARRPRE